MTPASATAFVDEHPTEFDIVAHPDGYFTLHIDVPSVGYEYSRPISQESIDAGFDLHAFYVCEATDGLVRHMLAKQSV